jgi:dienelactone hydrolase
MPRAAAGTLTAALAALALATPAGAATYAGSVTFRSAEPSGMTLELGRRTATVALGPGHAAHTVARVHRRGNRIAFSLPGRPAPLSFTLRRSGRRLAGTARQGRARAAVTLRRGKALADARLGLFTNDAGPFEVMRTTRFGYPGVMSVDLRTGAFGRRHGGTRVPVRQEEVRFRSHGIDIAGTLTLPLGTGPFAAAAYVSGSGETLREEAQYLGGYLVSRGIAVLAYDKRGEGESGGRYPGSLADDETLSTLADDAAAAARFLSAQPDLDRRRIGLFGLSQGGWIIPVAASRTPGVVSWALLQGAPAVTQGESDYYESLAQSWAGPLTDAEEQARAHGPSGFDPLPYLTRLRIPSLWLYGSDDRAEPPHTSIAVLRDVERTSPHEFTIRLYDGAPHPLFSRAGFAPGMFADLAAWIGSRGLG